MPRGNGCLFPRLGIHLYLGKRIPSPPREREREKKVLTDLAATCTVCIQQRSSSSSSRANRIAAAESCLRPILFVDALRTTAMCVSLSPQSSPVPSRGGQDDSRRMNTIQRGQIKLTTTFSLVGCVAFESMCRSPGPWGEPELCAQAKTNKRSLSHADSETKANTHNPCSPRNLSPRHSGPPPRPSHPPRRWTGTWRRLTRGTARAVVVRDRSPHGPNLVKRRWLSEIERC